MDAASADLARRLVACKQWRWMPGMAPLHVDEYPYINGTHIPHERAAKMLQGNPYHFPDLDDAATVGCLLAMLWEVYPEACLGQYDGPEWTVYYYCSIGVIGDADMIARPQIGPGSALAAALLAAWGSDAP